MGKEEEINEHGGVGKYEQNWDIFTPDERKILEKILAGNGQRKNLFFWKTTEGQIRGQCAENDQWYGWTFDVNMTTLSLKPVM